ARRNPAAAPDTPGGPPRGGTLTAAITADPGQLNPAITTSGDVHTASELMYNGLVRLTPDLQPRPELARSWEVEDAGRLYRFRLRDDVVWHDGKPFTSADVKFSFEEVLLKYHSRTAASVGQAIESIRTPDDHTVEFRFKEPYAPLLLQLDVTEAPIVAEHVYAGSDPLENPANLDPVGTGPFRLDAYRAGSEIRMTANPDYFKDGLPRLDEVVMRVVPDAGNQVVALEAGELDWLFGVPGPDLQRLAEQDQFEFLQTSVNPGGSNCIMTVSFNLERPVFGDVRTRRGIATALDRQQFVERVLFGQGRVAEAPISSGIPFAHADGLEGMPAYDPAEAERLLEEAGWVMGDDGVRVARGVDGVDDGTPLRFGFSLFPNFAPYGELLRAQLAEVGVDVRLEPLESDVFAERVFVDRKFDSNIISYCNGADPEIGVKRLYVSSTIGPVPFSNSSAYRNPEVDRLFEEARTTIDEQERGEVYRRIQEILVDEVPYFWIVETESTRVYPARCGGFSPAGHFAEGAYCRR
ncbi:MAG: ABC transporter substrate-binding protein, partial [Actinomycetota bacterium]|nr:ABC transporter substrate-binding protein [Actinomycetota bacterium]